MHRKILRIGLLVATSLVVLLVAASLILPRFFEKDLRQKLEEQLDAQLTAEVSFSHIGLSLLRHFPNLTLSLNNLAVVGSGYFHGDTLLAAKALRLELDLPSLLSHKTVVKGFYLDGPAVHVLVRKDGKANYLITKPDSTAKPDSTPSAFQVAVQRWAITEGTLTYDDKSQDLYAEMDHLNHSGRGDFTQERYDLVTQTDARQLTARYGGTTYVDHKELDMDLTLDVDAKANRYTFKDHAIRLNKFVLSMDGFFAFVEEGYKMDIHFQAPETKFENLLSLIPGVYLHHLPQLETKGELALEGSVKGIYDDSTGHMPAYELKAHVRDGFVKYKDLPEAVRDVRLELEVKNPTGQPERLEVLVDTFHLKLGKNPIEGHFKLVDLSRPTVQARFSGQLNLADVERFYPIKGTDMRGLLNFKGSADGQYDSLRHKVPRFTLDASLQQGYFKYDSLPKPLEHISVALKASNSDGVLEHTELDLTRLHAELENNPLEGKLVVHGLTVMVVDASLDMKLNLADVPALYPLPGVQLRGAFETKIRARGTYDAAKKQFPIVQAQLMLNNGYILNKSFPQPVENIHLWAVAENKTGALADTRLVLDTLTYSIADEPLSVQGTVTNLEDYTYDLEMKGVIDLEKLLKVFPLPGTTLTGRLTTDIETSGKLSDLEANRYTKLPTQGSMAVQNLAYKSKDLPEGFTIKDALLTFTPAKILLERFTGALGDDRFTLSGHLYNYIAFLLKDNEPIKGDLNLVCDTLNLNTFFAAGPAPAASPTPAVPDTARKPAAGPPLSVVQLPLNIDFTFNSDVAVAKYSSLVLTNLKGEIRLKQGVLTMREAGFNALGSTFNLSAEYDPRDIHHPRFALALKILDLDILSAYNTFSAVIDKLSPAAKNTDGLISVDYQVSGELAPSMMPVPQTLQGGGQLRIRNAKVKGMKMFHHISAEARRDELENPTLNNVVMVSQIKAGELTLNPFTFQVGGFEADVSGSQALAGEMNYLIKIALPPFDLVKVPIHVGGTYDKPIINMGKKMNAKELEAAQKAAQDSLAKNKAVTPMDSTQAKKALP